MDPLPKDPRKLGRLSPSEYETLQERFQSETVPRPSPQRAAAVGAWLPTVLKAFGIDRKQALHRVRSAWESIAGKAVAVRTFPARLENGTLTVHVLNAVWMAEISRLGKGHFIARAAAAGLSELVKAVHLKVGPLHDENQGN